MGNWFTNRAKSARACVLIAATLLATLAVVTSEASVTSLQSAIQTVYKEHYESIVRVKVATEEPVADGEPKVVLRVFSGFFISENGQVLTSHLPPNETTRVWIEQKGISYLADVVGSDARTNVALLQVINLPDSFNYIPLDAAKERQEIGALAFAITSPLDFNPTPKFGLVTGFESHFAEVVFPLTYTRLSISIGPAEGGSPAFDADNELMGIVMATLPEVESSYIIPARALARIVDQLETNQKVRYGVLPIEFEEKADSYNLSKRVVVKSIVPGSPAEKGGLLPSDQIVSLNGNAIENLNDLRDSIFFEDPGAFLLFKVKRDDKELDFAILLEPQEDHAPESSGAGARNTGR